MDLADVSPEAAEVTDPATADPWSGAVSRRLAGLAVARLVGQGLALVWFVTAARLLTIRDFGVLSGALAVMVVFGGLSDLGTTRGVVRHVSGDLDVLWPTVRRAVGLRSAGGVVVAGVCALVVWLAPIELPVVAALFAGWIALASGVAEVGYAGLRAAGLVGTEIRLLILERVLFTTAACTALALGAGPYIALALYGATNTLTAALATAVTHRRGRSSGRQAPPLLDREGRNTAIASSLVIVAPRIGPLLLVALSTPAAIGSFTVAQKPTEAISLVAVAMLVPVLPLLRSRFRQRRDLDGIAAGTQVAASVLVLAAPLVAWLIVDGADALRLLFGSDRRPGAATAVVILATAAVGAVLRSLGELLLLAAERAAVYVRSVTAGLVVAVAIGVALVPSHGAVGAAWSALAGEVVACAFALGALPELRRGERLRPFLTPLALAVATAVVLVALDGFGDGVTLGATAIATLAGLGLAWTPLREVDRVTA